MIKHNIYYDDRHQIVRVKLDGKIHSEDAGKMLNALADAFKGCKPCDILGDFTKVPLHTIDKKTRRILQEDASQLDIGRIAITGANPGVRMLARIVTTVIGKSDEVRFFPDQEKALAWLKGGE